MQWQAAQEAPQAAPGDLELAEFAALEAAVFGQHSAVANELEAMRVQRLLQLQLGQQVS